MTSNYFQDYVCLSRITTIFESFLTLDLPKITLALNLLLAASP